MKIAVHFVFIPKAELVLAAEKVGEARIVEPCVWTTHENDRTGMDHSQEDIERAFWNEFRANLFYENEADVQRRFRHFCNELGFSGCWSVLKTKGGGPAEDLIDSSREAEKFLAIHDTAHLPEV